LKLDGSWVRRCTLVIKVEYVYETGRITRRKGMPEVMPRGEADMRTGVKKEFDN